jgi:hypothetical protein
MSNFDVTMVSANRGGSWIGLPQDRHGKFAGIKLADPRNR